MEDNIKSYELLPNNEKIRLLRMKRDQYIHKITSTDLRWFQPQSGVFNIDEELERDSFEFSLIPIKSKRYYIKALATFGFSESFNEYGVRDIKHLKAIFYENKRQFIYTPTTPIRSGRNFIIVPTLLISEDAYNVEMICHGNLKAVTTDDLSSYKQFFTLRDGFERIADLPCGLEFIPRDEEEARLIKTLR